MPSSSTSATATPASGCSSSVAASSTSRSTTPKWRCARTSRARTRGSCRSTSAGTTGQATRPTPSGIKTDYLWKQILTREGLTDIIENYAQVVEEKNLRTGVTKKVQIFPRYHQLDVVRRLLADAKAQRRRAALPHPALGRQRQVELDRLAGPPDDRPAPERQARLRLDHRRHRPAHPRPADQGNDQGLRPSRGHHRDTRRARAICASSSRMARRSSSRRSRSSRSSSTRSATSSAAGTSPSSSMRRTRARAARPQRRSRWPSPPPAPRRTTRPSRTRSTA